MIEEELWELEQDMTDLEISGKENRILQLLGIKPT